METYFDNQLIELREKAKDIMFRFSHEKEKDDKSILIISEDFRKEFFCLVDKVNLRLMEDKDNFYGYFLFQMSREIRFDFSSPTAVNFKGANYVIYYNPMIFLRLNIRQMESTIKHEILHIVSLHLIRAKEYKGRYNVLAVNMAMDIVVNKYLTYLPGYATTLEWVNLKYNLRLEPYRPFEYYVEQLQKVIDIPEQEEETLKEDASEEDKKEVEVTKEDTPEAEGSEVDTLEADTSQKNPLRDHIAWYESTEPEYSSEKTHDLWEESGDIDEKTMQEFTEKVIRNSEKGELPTYLESMIAALKKNHGELPWNLYLNRLMGTVESNKKKTVTRRDRRQPDRLDLRGQLRSHKAKIVVALDISGSISDDEIKQAMKEVLNIVKNYNHEITILECDDRIRREYKVKSVKDIKTRISKIGGTKFNPVFEYANQNKVNLLVYFTDGEGEHKLKVIPRGYKILWVISGQGDHLSLREPYGAVKKLSNIKKQDNLIDSNDVEKGGYSMNNQEKMI
jgi:predicted metal-dependent peptidase